MANRAYLVGSKNDEPAGPSEKGINYDPDTEILAGASYCVPLLWLALFDQSSIRDLVIEEYKIPAPVTDAASARKLLKARSSRLLALLSDTNLFYEFETLIAGAPFEFFKIDAFEIWDLGPEEFAEELPAVMQWLETGDKKHFAALSELVGLNLPDELTANPPHKLSGDPQHFRGYKWVRPVPWAD
jgi:hypothetical protein